MNNAVSRDNDYDVAVVGYGPSGVTAANLLGAAGLRIVVIERDPEIFSRARAVSTDEEVMRIWQRLGLAERLKQDVLADRPIDFVDAGGRSIVRAALPARGHGHPPQMFIYQPALEQVLRDGVTRYPNVSVLLEHECLRVRQDDRGVEITTLGVAGDSVTRLRASYVIAADGGSSPIRAQLNVGYEGRTYEDRWVVIDTEMIQPWSGHDRLRFHCDPARPAVDCPTPLGHHRWEFPILPGEDENYLVSDEAVWMLLARYGIGEDDVKILRASVYSHHVRFAARWRVGRVFLAGDAAHAMPPWIGQGMCAGVRDVENLCWKLAAVVRAELPETVLDSYEAERQPQVREVTRRAVMAGRIITERRRLVTRLRNPLLRAVSANRHTLDFLWEHMWIPSARYAAGLRAGGKQAAVGRQIPQPWITDPAGTDLRLDDALGDGWRIVHARTVTTQPAWEGLGVTGLRVLPPGSTAPADGVIDRDGSLLAWMDRYGAATLALRPDGFVYAAAPAGAQLPPPPPGLAPATPTTSATPSTALAANL